jgi:hypothetical protein
MYTAKAKPKPRIKRAMLDKIFLIAGAVMFEFYSAVAV